jgi:hypothetical protein
MAMRCEEIKEMLPAYARGEDESLAVRRHLSRCADCRTEAERYDVLRATLGELRSVASEVPAGLKSALIDIPQRADRVAVVKDHLTRNRGAYAGGLAAAAAVAGAAVWRTRRRVATA